MSVDDTRTRARYEQEAGLRQPEERHEVEGQVR